jgi:mono/diheme cytochrome c family protein
MNRTRLIKRAGLLIAGQILFFSPIVVHAQEDTIDVAVVEDTTLIAEVAEEEPIEEDIAETVAEDTTVILIGDIDRGKALFQGGASFFNGGPSCIGCHNVNHEDVYPGGLFAKDLTDVYTRYGEGLASWLGAPSFPAMAASYNNNPLTEQERVDLAAFLKNVEETKDSAVEKSGGLYLFIGGGLGLICLLVLVQLLWSKRKTKMVKADIFARQNKAWDAKF